MPPTTPAGKTTFQMMGVFAEFERSMIRERVNAGIARAKRVGWACRHEHPDQGRRLTSPIRAEPDKPAASTGGPAVGFEEAISLRRHPPQRL